MKLQRLVDIRTYSQILKQLYESCGLLKSFKLFSEYESTVLFYNALKTDIYIYDFLPSPPTLNISELNFEGFC
jgi:hypothetical protein